jgi:succinate-acetate transporter protein
VLGTWGALLLGCSVVAMLAVPDASMGSVDRLEILGFPFFALAAITWITVVSASTRSAALAVVCAFLALSSTVAAVAYFVSSPNVALAAGWLFEIAAGCASYTASAILLNRAAGRVILPLG